MHCLHVYVSLLVVLHTAHAQSGTTGEDISGNHGYTARDIIRAIEHEVEDEHLGTSGSASSADDEPQDSVDSSSPEDEVTFPPKSHTTPTPSILSTSSHDRSRDNTNKPIRSNHLNDKQSDRSRTTNYKGEGDDKYDDEDFQQTSDERGSGKKSSRMEFAHLEKVADVMKKLKKSKTDDEMAAKLRTGAKQVMHSIVKDMVDKTAQTVSPKIDSMVHRGFNSVMANASAPAVNIKNQSSNVKTAKKSPPNGETIKVNVQLSNKTVTAKPPTIKAVNKTTAPNLNKESNKTAAKMKTLATPRIGTVRVTVNPVHIKSKNSSHSTTVVKNSTSHVNKTILKTKTKDSGTKDSKKPITTVVSFVSGKNHNNTNKTQNRHTNLHNNKLATPQTKQLMDQQNTTLTTPHTRQLIKQHNTTLTTPQIKQLKNQGATTKRANNSNQGITKSSKNVKVIVNTTKVKVKFEKKQSSKRTKEQDEHKHPKHGTKASSQGISVKKGIVANTEQGSGMQPQMVPKMQGIPNYDEKQRLDNIQNEVSRLENELTILQTAVAGVIKKLRDIEQVTKEVSNFSHPAVQVADDQHQPLSGTTAGQVLTNQHKETSDNIKDNLTGSGASTIKIFIRPEQENTGPRPANGTNGLNKVELMPFPENKGSNNTINVQTPTQGVIEPLPENYGPVRNNTESLPGTTGLAHGIMVPFPGFAEPVTGIPVRLPGIDHPVGALGETDQSTANVITGPLPGSSQSVNSHTGLWELKDQSGTGVITGPLPGPSQSVNSHTGLWEQKNQSGTDVITGSLQGPSQSAKTHMGLWKQKNQSGTDVITEPLQDPSQSAKSHTGLWEQKNQSGTDVITGSLQGPSQSAKSHTGLWEQKNQSGTNVITGLLPGASQSVKSHTGPSDQNNLSDMEVITGPPLGPIQSPNSHKGPSKQKQHSEPSKSAKNHAGYSKQTNKSQNSNTGTLTETDQSPIDVITGPLPSKSAKGHQTDQSGKDNTVTAEEIDQSSSVVITRPTDKSNAEKISKQSTDKSTSNNTGTTEEPDQSDSDVITGPLPTDQSASNDTEPTEEPDQSNSGAITGQLPTDESDQSASDNMESVNESDQSASDVITGPLPTDQSDSTKPSIGTPPEPFTSPLPYSLAEPYTMTSPRTSPMTSPIFFGFDGDMRLRPTPPPSSPHQIYIPLGSINGLQAQPDLDTFSDIDERNRVHTPALHDGNNQGAKSVSSDKTDRLKSQGGLERLRSVYERMYGSKPSVQVPNIADVLRNASYKDGSNAHDIVSQQKIAMNTPQEDQKRPNARPIINIIVPNQETASLLQKELCQPVCKNGGKCIGYNTCKCPTLFLGDQCERFSLLELLNKKADQQRKRVYESTPNTPRVSHRRRITVDDLIRSLATDYRSQKRRYRPQSERQVVSQPFQNVRDAISYRLRNVRDPLSYRLQSELQPRGYVREPSSYRLQRAGDPRGYRLSNIRVPSYYRSQNDDDYVQQRELNARKRKSIIPRRFVTRIDPVTKRKQYLLEM